MAPDFVSGKKVVADLTPWPHFCIIVYMIWSSRSFHGFVYVVFRPTCSPGWAHRISMIALISGPLLVGNKLRGCVHATVWRSRFIYNCVSWFLAHRQTGFSTIFSLFFWQKVSASSVCAFWLDMLWFFFSGGRLILVAAACSCTQNVSSILEVLA
jgi:hypothetical protein